MSVRQSKCGSIAVGVSAPSLDSLWQIRYVFLLQPLSYTHRVHRGFSHTRCCAMHTLTRNAHTYAQCTHPAAMYALCLAHACCCPMPMPMPTSPTILCSCSREGEGHEAHQSTLRDFKHTMLTYVVLLPLQMLAPNMELRSAIRQAGMARSQYV